MTGIIGDVLLNPHHYGEYVHWTWRSTVMAYCTVAIWLAPISITRWVVRRESRR